MRIKTFGMAVDELGLAFHQDVLAAAMTPDQ
jgi:hypothetical protein